MLQQHKRVHVQNLQGNTSSNVLRRCRLHGWKVGDDQPENARQIIHFVEQSKLCGHSIRTTRCRTITGASSGGRAQPTVNQTRASSTFKVQLIQPTNVPRPDACDKLLVYLPGTDGTGQAILPQIPALRSLGYDVWCLYLPPEDRSDWEQLTTQVTLLLRQLRNHWCGGHPQGLSPAGGENRRITIIAESFGCCLALRLAASGAGPELLDRMVLVNPATSFNRSLSGLSSLIAATNLLSLFPRDWYAVAQATLLPLLVDGARVEPANQQLLQSMILMEPPASSQSFGFGAGGPPLRLPSFAGAPGDPTTAPGSAAQGAGVVGSASAFAGNGAMGSSAVGGGGSGSDGGTLYYGPAAAANFRTNLLRDGDPGEAVLSRVSTPVLLVTSARDRLLPSILEGARLERALPNARRYILPDSGHAAMLERGFNMEAVMAAAAFAARPHPPQQRSSGGPGSKPGPGGSARVSKQGDDVVSAAGVAPQSPPPVPTTQAVEGRQGPGTQEAMQPSLSIQDPLQSAAADMAAANGMMAAALSVSASGRPNPATGWWSGPGGDGSGVTRAPEGSMDASADEAAARERAASSASAGPSGASSSSPYAAGNATEGRRQTARAGAGGKREGSVKGSGGLNSGEDEPKSDINSAFDEWCQNLGPWRDMVSPVVLGFEHLPPPESADFSRPMLFVGNHQKMGFYDTPLLVYELYVRGYRVRGLAHPGHWAGPFGRWFESFGTVKASPMAAFRLLRAKEKVLLFPGGAKEVVKKRGQEYKLLWKDSPDFVRLAARCDALIVPFAAVGADDAYDVIMDTDEVIAHPVLGPLTKGLLGRVSSALDPVESIFPITKLPVVGLPTPIPIPNLQRLYFRFSPPVDPRGVNINDPQQVQELYDGVKGTVTQCMAELLELRESDEENQLGPRLTRSLQRMVPVLGAAATSPAAPSSPPLSSEL